MLTADTITDEQIRELRAGAAVTIASPHYIRDCVVALGPSEVLAPGSVLDPAFATWVPNTERAAARARCAEIINARKAAEPLTADTVTDRDIRDLRKSLVGTDNLALHAICGIALDGVESDSPSRSHCRKRCADAINARKAA